MKLINREVLLLTDCKLLIRGIQGVTKRTSLNTSAKKMPSDHQQRKNKNKRTPLVVSYNANLPYLTALTQKKTPILNTSNRLKQAIPELPNVAYRWCKNYRDLLVSAELKDTRQLQTSRKQSMRPNVPTHPD